MNYVVSVTFIALGLLVIDNRQSPWHVVAGLIFIAAGLLFLL